MPFKVVFDKEIHVYKGDQTSFSELFKFIQNYVKEPFQLFFKDQDGDNITISCDQDLSALQNEKNVKIYVQLASSSESTQEDFQVVEKKLSESEEFEKVNLDIQNQKKQSNSPTQQQQPFQNIADLINGGFDAFQNELPKWCKRLGNMEGCHQKKGMMMERRMERIKACVDQQITEKLPQIAQYVEKYLKGEKPVMLEQQKPQFNEVPSSSNVVHKNFVCDGCEASPIVGVRYQCSVCEDFDFCEKCEANKEHPHPFLKIRRPEQAVKAIFCCVNEQPLEPFLNHLKNTSFPQVKEMVQDSIKDKKKDVYKTVTIDEEPKQKPEKKEKRKSRKSSAPKKQPVVQQEAPKMTDQVKPEEPKYSWTVQNKANLLQQATGHDLNMILEFVNAMPNASMDELFEILITQIPQQQQQQTQVISKPVEKVEKKKAKSSKKKSSKEAKEVEKKPEVTQKQPEKKKEFDQQVIKNARIVASNMGGQPEDFYEIVEALSFLQTPAEIMQSIFNDREAQKQYQKKEATTTTISTNTPKLQESNNTPKQEAPKTEKKPARKTSPQKKEATKVEIVTVESPKQVVLQAPKVEYSQKEISKSKLIQQVCGGKEEDYYQIVHDMGNMHVNEIIEVVLAQKELDEKNNKSKQLKESQKKIEETPTEKKEAPKVEIKKEAPKVEKIKQLKKAYSENVFKKAQSLSEVLGGDKNDYCQIVETYCFSTVNDLAEMLINDPEIIQKYSSYN